MRIPDDRNSAIPAAAAQLHVLESDSAGLENLSRRIRRPDHGIAATAGYDLKGIWKTALLYGVVVLCGQYSFYQAADAAAECGWSSAVYPAAVGTCILLFSVYRVFFKKEKLSLYGWLGILFIISGIAGLSAKK